MNSLEICLAVVALMRYSNLVILNLSTTFKAPHWIRLTISLTKNIFLMIVSNLKIFLIKLTRIKFVKLFQNFNDSVYLRLCHDELVLWQNCKVSGQRFSLNWVFQKPSETFHLTITWAVFSEISNKGNKNSNVTEWTCWSISRSFALKPKTSAFVDSVVIAD